MSNNVYVLADENGGVITVSKNNPEYGWVVFAQDTVTTTNGWINVKVRKARQMGTVETLERGNFKANQEMPGQIIIQESLEAFNEKDPERDLKIAGTTGVICTREGNPIYRRVIYTLDSTLTDTLIQHDNVDEIRQALNEQTVSNKSVTPSANTQEELADVFEM